MADSTKLASMIALVIAGLLIIAWGAIYIWLYRNDQAVVATLVANGSIQPAQAARFTSSTWIWILSIVQIIIGIALIIWGIFQYYSSVDEATVYVKKNVIEPTKTYFRSPTAVSRQVTTTTETL